MGKNMETFLIKDIIRKTNKNINEKTWYVYIHIIPKAITGYNHDKYYVGITSQDKPHWRWRANGYGYKGNCHFWRAIQKYGWDNIQHDVIASGLTKSEAVQMEIKLIKLLQSNDKMFGYNSTTGGDGYTKPQTEEMKQLLSQVARERWKNPVYREKLSGVNSPNYGQGEKISQYLPKGENASKARKVVCLNTKEIFGCIRYATKKYGIPETNITKNCKHKAHSAGKDQHGNKLVWAYYEDYLNMSSEEIEQLLNHKNMTSAKKVVNCLTGETYNSITEAAKDTNVDRNLIGRHVNHQVKNPLWMYYDEYIESLDINTIHII